MSYSVLTPELRRFIYSIASIPQLEAMLLLHQNAGHAWDACAIAKRLYISDELAGQVLEQLVHSGVCAPAIQGQGNCIYAPASAELHAQIALLADYYSSHLIEVTNMIHAKTSGGRVQQFADAFKFKKDK